MIRHCLDYTAFSVSSRPVIDSVTPDPTSVGGKNPVVQMSHCEDEEVGVDGGRFNIFPGYRGGKFIKPQVDFRFLDFLTRALSIS